MSAPFSAIRDRVYGEGKNRGEFTRDDCNLEQLLSIYGPCHNDATSLVANWSSTAGYNQSNQIDLGFAFREDWGAQAILKSPFRFIVLSFKLPLMCHRLAQRLLGRQDTFGWVGRPDVERASVVESASSIVCSPRARGMGTAEWIREQAIEGPRCPVRLQVARRVTRIIFHTVILHEMAHHCYGHLDLCLPQNHTLAWDGQPDWLDLQAMELDADAFAANQVIRILLLAARDGQWISESWRALSPNLVDAAKAIGMILGSIYWMFDPFARTLMEHNREHPHPFARMCVVGHTCETWATRHCRDQAENVQSALFEGYRQASTIFAGTSEQYQVAFPISVVGAYFEDIEDRMVRLRSKLASFARVPLPVRDD